MRSRGRAWRFAVITVHTMAASLGAVTATTATTAVTAVTAVTATTADGNRVILELGDGRFAFDAHLEPDSIVVKKGDRVRVGQVIARTGDSGSSTGPHLHFQVMDRPSALVTFANVRS